MSLYLLVVWGDLEPEIQGPYDSDALRLDAAREIRTEHGDEHGLHRIDTGPEKPKVEAFYGWELGDEEEPINCPKDDPDCLGGDADCHDACEAP